MKKRIIYILLILLFVLSCNRATEKGYEHMEKALIGIMENKGEKYIKREFIQAIKNGNKDIFSLIYFYYGNSDEDFLEKYFKKSDGLAEYYKGLILKEKKVDEKIIVSLFESSAKQGNIKAYYMLGNIYEEKLNFSKAQEYYEKGKSQGEIYSTYAFNYNKNLQNEYKKIEELYKKYNNKNIGEEEKKELGRLLIEKFGKYELAYEILKVFVEENYAPAVFSKAKMLENENKRNESLKIYNELFLEQKYYLAAYELAYDLVNNKNYELAIKVLENIDSEEALIYGYKGYIYENLKNYDEAEKNYKLAVKKNDVDIMVYLGKIYENKNELKKAKEIYEKGYHLGSINSAFGLVNILNTINNDNKNKESKKILEKLVANGNDAAMVDLSVVYGENDKHFRKLNLKAATSFNPTALYNLGVYYYNENDKEKAKIYFKNAKELGYELDKELESYIKN